MTIITLKRRMRAKAKKLGIEVPRGFRVVNRWGKPAQRLAARLQRHYKILPTGRPSWALKWKLMTLRERIAYLAAKEVGVMETSPNWSPRIRDYLLAAKIGFPTAWCAAFVTYVVHKAGWRGSLPDKLAWVPSWATWARQRHYDVTPLAARKGDIVCLNWPGTDATPDHIAVVTKNYGYLKQLTTVGGNEGDAVRRAWRPYYQAHTVIRLPNA